MFTSSGRLTGAGNAGEPLHGAQAHVEVQHLAQRDVERADAAADRGRERALDADEYSLNASTVSSGSQLLKRLKLSSPAKTSNQEIFLLPP
jgi:hypothetical protein